MSTIIRDVLRYYITDRRKLTAGVRIEDVVAANLLAEVDFIQLREKDLPAHELFKLVERVLALPNPQGTKILINGRVDVALASGAHGVHLPSQSPPPNAWPRFGLNEPGLIWGVSCHTVAEVQQAEQQGADYVLFGPVFAPLSKASDLAPRGLPDLQKAAQAVRIPVLALGGITEQNSIACMAHGAAGVAGITLFQTGFRTGAWRAC